MLLLLLTWFRDMFWTFLRASKWKHNRWVVVVLRCTCTVYCVAVYRWQLDAISFLSGVYKFTCTYVIVWTDVTGRSNGCIDRHQFKITNFIHNHSLICTRIHIVNFYGKQMLEIWFTRIMCVCVCDTIRHVCKCTFYSLTSTIQQQGKAMINTVALIPCNLRLLWLNIRITKLAIPYLFYLSNMFRVVCWLVASLFQCFLSICIYLIFSLTIHSFHLCIRSFINSFSQPTKQPLFWGGSK